MEEITVRTLGEDEWHHYRDLRLASLHESPEAFTASHDEESGFHEDVWRERMQRSTRVVAERDGKAVGIVSVGEAEPLDEDDDVSQVAEIFGLWVEPEARGSGVAMRLVRAAAGTAASAGNRKLLYWVGSDNGHAVAFASSYGFRPTANRRPMGVATEEDGDEEVCMELALHG